MFKGPVVSGSLKYAHLTHPHPYFRKPKPLTEPAYIGDNTEPNCEPIDIEEYRFVQVCACGSGFWEVI